jgi:hypothetical protein
MDIAAGLHRVKAQGNIRLASIRQHPGSLALGPEVLQRKGPSQPLYHLHRAHVHVSQTYILDAGRKKAGGGARHRPTSPTSPRDEAIRGKTASLNRPARVEGYPQPDPRPALYRNKLLRSYAHPITTTIILAFRLPARWRLLHFAGSCFTCERAIQEPTL